MSRLEPATVVQRSQEPVTTSLDEELVMLDLRQSRYFGVDAIGHRVWDLMEQPVSVSDLCAALEREFDVTPNQCRNDVLAFLEQLREADLIEIH
jgi:hypothetical protein